MLYQINPDPNINQNYPAATELHSSELDLLRKQSHSVLFKAGDWITKPHTPASHTVLIEDGLVKTTLDSANGRSNILEIHGKGHFVGLMQLLSNEANMFTTIALTNTRALLTQASTFRGLMQENHQFANKIMAPLCRQNTSTIHRLVTINNKQLPGRVADVILYFYELNQQNLRFELPLSRSELAQFAGTTKESFIRTLAEFRNDKIIDITDRQVCINSLDIVKTLSRLG